MSRDTHATRLGSDLLHAAVRSAVHAVEATAFWAAVLFPLVYVGAFLAAAALPDLGVLRRPVVAGLLAANVLALVVGHHHRGE